MRAVSNPAQCRAEHSAQLATCANSGRASPGLTLRRMQHAECAAPVRPHQHERILTARHGR